MALAIDRGGQNSVEGVYPQVTGENLILMLQSEPSLIVGVVVAIAESLAESECRRVGERELRQGYRAVRHQRIGILCPVVYTHIAFKQCTDTIERALASTGGNRELARAAGDLIAVFTHRGSRASQHHSGHSLSGTGGQRQSGARYAFHKLVEHPGGCRVGCRRLLNDDTGFRTAILHQCYLCLGSIINA